MGMAVAVVPAAGDYGEPGRKPLQQLLWRGILRPVMGGFQYAHIPDVPGFQFPLQGRLPLVLHVPGQEQRPVWRFPFSALDIPGAFPKLHIEAFRVGIDILRTKALAGVEAGEVRAAAAKAHPGPEIPYRHRAGLGGLLRSRHQLSQLLLSGILPNSGKQ